MALTLLTFLHETTTYLRNSSLGRPSRRDSPLCQPRALSDLKNPCCRAGAGTCQSHGFPDPAAEGVSVTASAFDIQSVGHPLLTHTNDPPCLQIIAHAQSFTIILLIECHDQTIRFLTGQRSKKITDNINIPFPHTINQSHLPPKSTEHSRQCRQNLRLPQFHART